MMSVAGRLFGVLSRLAKTIRFTGMAGTKPAVADGSRLVWIDCEMSGLDLEKHRLVEIAVVITENDLTSVDEMAVVINQPKEIMDDMNEWCQNTFRGNGLLDRINNSRINERQAENMVLEFLQRHTAKGECPLAGNSVHMDKYFLMRYMPRVVEHLHYRIVDVSSLKELVKRWYPMAKMPEKQNNHLALDDIRESIKELRWYKENYFRELPK